MKGMLDAAMSRVSDSHKVQQEQYKATLEGRQPDFTDVETGDEDMAGDINVAGDTTTTNHYHYPDSKPAEAGKEAPSAVRNLLPLATAALLGAGGLWAYESLKGFEWPGVADASYEVRFYNADGELIEVPRYSEK